MTCSTANSETRRNSQTFEINLADYTAIHDSMESAANMLAFLSEVFDGYGSDGFTLQPSAACGLVTFLDMALKNIEEALSNAPFPPRMSNAEASND